MRANFTDEIRSYSFLLFLAGCLLFFSGKIGAQTLMDNLAAMQIGEQVGSNIGNAVNAAAEMRSLGNAASMEIDAARNQYWQAVKTGKGIDAAGENFRHQLWLKDLYYLMFSIPEGTSGPGATVLNFISGDVDGGIQPAARPYFENWVKAIRVHLGAETWFAREETHQFVLPGLTALAEALAAAKEHYTTYVRVRDWAEIDASGLTFPWDKDAKSHILMILHRYSPEIQPEQTQENYRELSELFGEKEVLAAGELIRTAPRSFDGKIANPAALGIYSRNPGAAFVEILATASGKTYFKYLLWQKGHTPAEAGRLYDFHTYIFDPKQIEIAANKVLQAEKSYGNILSVDARSELGITDMELVPAIQSLAANGDPLGNIKIIVAKGINCTSKEQFDQTFTELLKKYGEEKLLKCYKAYYTHQSYQGVKSSYRTPEQQEKAVAIIKEFEGKNLDEEQQQYHLLMKALKNGIYDVYALGFPGE